MYYRLKSNYLMRGWKLLPFGIVDKNSYETFFIPSEYYGALKYAVNGIDEDSILFSQQQRDFLKMAESNGILEKTELPSKLTSQQEYIAYPSRFIHSVQWSITGRCNYRCRHCYMSAPHAKYSELSHETCMEIIRQLAECGIRRVALTGGEALVRNDFWEIVDELRKNDMYIYQIYSNGKLVTKDFLEKLQEREMRPEINISFDGVGWHDWLRGVEGAEKIAIDAFKLCKEMGFPTGAEFCMHKGNKDTLRESVNLLASLGVRFLKVSPAMNVGEWATFGTDMMLTQKEVFDSYLDYLPYYIEDGRPMEIQLSELFASAKDKGYLIPGCRGVKQENVCSHCLCGHARTALYITADGRWMPCMPMSANEEIAKKFPSIHDTPLKDALNQSYYMTCINKRLSEYLEHNPKCAACQYRLDCASGCRGRAVTKDDYLAIDEEACVMFEGGYVKRVRKMMEDLNVPLI